MLAAHMTQSSCSKLASAGFFLPASAVDAYAQAAVCAEVKIEIKQRLPLERQAFDTVIRIKNGLDGTSIDSIVINVKFSGQSRQCRSCNVEQTRVADRFSDSGQLRQRPTRAEGTSMKLPSL